MAKRDRHPAQADLFEVSELFPVHAPAEVMKALDFNRRLAMAMSEAISRSGKTREAIAAEMTEILGYEEDNRVTLSMVNAYTSVARETHTISVVRLLAFARATGCSWIWQSVLKDEGLTILEGKEAHFAQAAIYRKQAEELMARADAALAEAPSQVRVPRGRK